MRIALVAETFLPQMNGVVNSVLQALRYLSRQGHELLVIAPRGPGVPPPPELLHGAGFVAVSSAPAPSYPEVRLSFATVGRIEAILRSFRPDVVHLASPFLLGWRAQLACENLGLPTVAIYQTDIPGFAERYRLPGLMPALEQRVVRLHNRASLTLAPSTASLRQLGALGVQRVRRWARGVDGELFTPRRRSAALRARLAPNGEVLIGYAGRLAPEKRVEELAGIADLPHTRLVVIGDGPSRPLLEKLLPTASFLGFLSGEELAEAVASLDLFVHPGENETFGQAIQEALCSGVPVVAPGRGGPVDLVQSSRTGWLYAPGDRDDLRARVLDLVGDDAKRRAFGLAARACVESRTWARLVDELVGHYQSVLPARMQVR